MRVTGQKVSGPKISTLPWVVVGLLPPDFALDAAPHHITAPSVSRKREVFYRCPLSTAFSTKWALSAHLSIQLLHRVHPAATPKISSSLFSLCRGSRELLGFVPIFPC